jgi:hypothetical protein
VRFCGDFSSKEKESQRRLHVSLGRKGMDEEIGDTVYTLVVIGHSAMRLPARWVSAPLPRPPAPLSPGRNPRIETRSESTDRASYRLEHPRCADSREEQEILQSGNRFRRRDCRQEQQQLQQFQAHNKIRGEQPG